ncbi:hypothetical protein J4408_00485 [Candidatus Pacearchaeota archaeon]|nr:hypothetical protein [Candidatus Pacearchaeota archaeon]
MKWKEPKMPGEGQSRLILELSRQYDGPYPSTREYGTNGLDAIEEDRRNGLIDDSTNMMKFLAEQSTKRVIIQDFAAGISSGRMQELPESIGKSIKSGKFDQRGEKAVGLLAFGSMGTSVDIISKMVSEKTFNHLRYEIIGKAKDGDERVVYKIDTLSREDMDKLYCGKFDHGTKILINTNAHVIKRMAFGRLRNFVQSYYAPILKRNASSITFIVGDIDKGLEEKVTFPEIKGNILADGAIQIDSEIAGDRRAKVDFHLVFDHDSERGGVPVFSKGVKIYDNVLELDESLGDTALWTCPHIQGYVNEETLKVTLGRNGINRESMGYKSLVQLLRIVDGKLRGKISQNMLEKDERRDTGIIKEGWKLMEKVYQTTVPLDKDDRVASTRSESGTQSPDKELKKKKPRVFPFQEPVRTSFSEIEKHLRAKLTPMGTQYFIYVNVSHPDYKFAFGNGKRDRGLDYLFEVSAPIIAQAEMKNSIEKKRKMYGSVYQIAGEISNRAQDIIFQYRKLRFGK